jgi:hypothetical protein
MCDFVSFFSVGGWSSSCDTSLQNFIDSSLVLYAWIYEVHISHVAAALCNQTVVNVVVNILSVAIDWSYMEHSITCTTSVAMWSILYIIHEQTTEEHVARMLEKFYVCVAKRKMKVFQVIATMFKQCWTVIRNRNRCTVLMFDICLKAYNKQMNINYLHL